MSKDIELILSGIMGDILQEIHKIIASEVGVNQKVGINTLEYSNLNSNIKGEVKDNQLNIEFPFYTVYIEWTRPPEYGKQPPTDVIIQWLKERILSPTAKNIHQLQRIAWVIARSIWLEGWKGRVIAGLTDGYNGSSPLDEYIEREWKNKWADELFNAITKDLDKYFND